MSPDTTERVVLVNERDEEIGTEEKLRAHQLGVLHRAFSVFIFNRRGETLLQRRALDKYHSAGLWSNTACGHPRPGEAVDAAARRRLREEMGIDCELTEVTFFHYQATVELHLAENEIDHVFLGTWDGTPQPSPQEVGDWNWRTPSTLERELRESPKQFSAWLPLAWAALKRIDPFVLRPSEPGNVQPACKR